MNLPKPYFERGTYKLTVNAKHYLKAFLKKQELSKINNLVGYTPDPEHPCPPPRWPYSRRNLFGNPLGFENVINLSCQEPVSNFNAFNLGQFTYPDPDDIDPWPWPFGPLVKDLINERLYELINKTPLNTNTFNFIDVLKREQIAVEALNELKDDLSTAQKTIAMRLKKLH